MRSDPSCQSFQSIFEGHPHAGRAISQECFVFRSNHFFPPHTQINYGIVVSIDSLYIAMSFIIFLLINVYIYMRSRSQDGRKNAIFVLVHLAYFNKSNHLQFHLIFCK